MKSLKRTPDIPSGKPLKSRLSVFSKLAFTLMAVTLLSCGEKECVEPSEPAIPICPPYHPHDPNQPDPIACNPDTYVTVTNVGCGVGVWGAYWFRLDNGDYLQPWVSNDLSPVQPGQRYRISFEPVTPDSRYDHVVTCMAATPASTPIRINCMQPVTNP